MFFNPEARERREQDQSLAQLYALQLHEVHTTIHRLEEEVSRLRDGVNLQQIRLQDEVGRLQRENTQLTIDNSNLLNRLELLQFRVNMQQPGPMFGSACEGGGMWGGNFGGGGGMWGGNSGPGPGGPRPNFSGSAFSGGLGDGQSSMPNWNARAAGNQDGPAIQRSRPRQFPEDDMGLSDL